MNDYLKKLEKKALKKLPVKKKQLKKLSLSYTLKSFRTLGQYSPLAKTILINQKLLEEVGPKKYFPVFRHEYGHFLTHILYPAAAAHGKELKMIMRILGDIAPSAKTSILSKDIKSAYSSSFVEAKCKCSTHKISAHKAGRIRNKTNKYRCVYCHSKLKLKKD